MSKQILIIDKTGDIKEKKTKNLDCLYKVCNYRNNNHFDKQHIWNVKMNKQELKIEIWAKTQGQAGIENKYEFPPPIDKQLYFGTCCLVCYKNGEIINFEKKIWNIIYEKLYGGFEDLGENDSEVSEDSIDEHDTTKQGYSKEDGFIVSDDDEDDNDYQEEDGEFGLDNDELSEESYVSEDE